MIPLFVPLREGSQPGVYDQGVDAIDAIRARRNVRTYADRPIAEADLELIAEAAWRTPSSQNQQRWDFVICTAREQLEALSKVWRGAGHVASAAAAVVMVAPNDEDESSRLSIYYDLGQATMSIMIAATALGIGSAHALVREQELAREIIGFPEDRICPWMVGLGYPADRPLAPVKRLNRRPIEEVIHRERW